MAQKFTITVWKDRENNEDIFRAKCEEHPTNAEGRPMQAKGLDFDGTLGSLAEALQQKISGDEDVDWSAPT
jgi:hypothetical protein